MKTPIPIELREQLAQDPRMRVCCVADGDCAGRVEWHHALIYAGRAVQRSWAILGICQHHHALADRPDLRAKIVAVMRELGGDEIKSFEKIKKL